MRRCDGVNQNGTSATYAAVNSARPEAAGRICDVTTLTTMDNRQLRGHALIAD